MVVNNKLGLLTSAPTATYPNPINLHSNGVTLVAGPSAVTGESYKYNGTSYLIVDDETIRDNDNKTANIVTTRVTDMRILFYANVLFNQNVSSWDTGAVTNMVLMFYGATAFNGDISSWNTAGVTDMDYMFMSATAFNQNLTGWCVTEVTTEPTGFSTNSALTPANKPDWGTCP